jgi:hypothetical protein
MNLTLGRTFKQHLHQKMEKDGIASPTWKKIKQWLVEFTDTPKQKVKGINELLKLAPVAGETIEEFARRLAEMGNNMELDNISLQEFMFVSTMSRMPIMWQEKILQLVFASRQPIMTKKWAEYCAFLANVDVDPVTVHAGASKRKFEASEELMKSKYANKGKERATFEPRLCNLGCGQPFVLGHHLVCPNGKHKAPQFDRKPYHHQPGPSKVHKATRSLVRTTPAAHISDKALERTARQVHDDDYGKKMDCKFIRKTKKYQDDKYEQEINVPLFIGNDPVMGYLDTGANISFLSYDYCFSNKISILPHKNKFETTMSDGQSAKNYGHTEPLTIVYNGKQFKFKFDVVDLAFNRVICLGMNITKYLGIGFTGLIATWAPVKKSEEESPFKDVPIPNQDPFGSPAEQSTFLKFIQPSIDANQNIPTSTFCTHPDATIYLDTPPDAVGYRSQYAIADKLKPKVDETVKKWLHDGIITEVPSNIDNRWNSPIILVPKKDSAGNYTDKRPCLDPRHINKYLKEDKFPLPKINDIFLKLKGANIYTTLDLTQAFHRFPIHPPDQHKTAFTSVDGKQYMFLGCPFGLKPISAKFQRVMTHIFSKSPFFNFVSTFVDDIVIYSKTLEEHAAHTKLVIQELSAVNLILNPAKCHFAQKTIFLLGFCVSQKGSTTLDHRKVANTQDWPVPATGKAIQQYLGLINYFRYYIPTISTLTAPLDKLRSHEGKLGKLWTDEQASAFNLLKEALVRAPILCPPDADLPFHVATDASDVGIGAVLYQVDLDKKIIYNGFMARSLSKSEKNYGTTGRELLAIVFALNKFHQHLWGRHFTLHTDHKALIYIHTQKDLNAMLTKWFDTILDYNFDIVHLPGMDNVIPDALSRLYHTEKELEGDNDRHQETMRSDSYASNEVDDCIRTINREYLENNMLEPPSEVEKLNILEKAHAFGHFGAQAIIKYIHNNGMHWKYLDKQALKISQKCVQCQKFNIQKTGYNPHRPVHAKLPGDHWAIDLAGPLPQTEQNNNYLLVMIDICSRFVVLKPIQNKKAPTIAKALIEVFCEFGIPQIVQSDNGKEFVNQVMTRFKTQAGFDHRLITPYYPQSNGAAERTVGSSMTLLKKLVEGVTGEWDLYIPSVQLAMNNKYSQRLDATPFSVMFGRKMNDFISYTAESEILLPLTPLQIKERLQQLENIVFPAIAEKTKKAIDTQKSKFDATHLQKDIPIGSSVRIKINKGFRAKMDPIYEGPYSVIRRNDQGSYTLKNSLGELLPRSYAPTQLIVVPNNNNDDENCFEIEKILDHELDMETNKYKYLIKWKDYEVSENTWEPAHHIHSDAIIKEYWTKVNKQPQRKRKATSNDQSKKYSKSYA